MNHDRPDILWRLALSAWVFGFESGFLPKILGVVLMVHCFTWLSTSLQFFLFPGLHGDHLCELASWLPCRIWAYLVAVDQRGERAGIKVA